MNERYGFLYGKARGVNATTDRPVARLRINVRESDGVAICGVEWVGFWQQLRRRLLDDGYRTNTLRVYRQILRDLRTFLRDRLLVALLAGCGLRVSEACRIRWADFDRAAGALRIEDPAKLRSRTVAVPRGLAPMFEGLAAISRASDPMICGRYIAAAVPGPLSVRQAERLIQAAAKKAEILKRVNPMVLRHTYALRRLIAGDNIRAVQEALGHRSVVCGFACDFRHRRLQDRRSVNRKNGKSGI